MLNKNLILGLMSIMGDDMYAYLATGTSSITGISEGDRKKIFILPAPTDKITVSSGSGSYYHLKAVLQTPSGNSTTYSVNIEYEGEAPRSRSNEFSGLFPQGTKIIVTDTDDYSNARYATCTHNTLTFYKIPSDCLRGGVRSVIKHIHSPYPRKQLIFFFGG